MRRFSLLTLLALGCGQAASGPDRVPGFDPAPPPPNGMQVLSPIVHGIQAGSDNEICTWSDITLSRTMDVRKITGFQTETGHHVVLYYTNDYQPAGTTRPCTDDDMSTFRFIAGAGAEGLPSEAPGSLVFRVPAKAQLVLNHHYLNASAKPYDVQSAINVFPADPAGTYTPSGALTVTDTGIKVPPGLSHVDITGVLQHDFNLWFLIPHMHQWGSSITITRTHQGQVEKLFDVAHWDPGFMFHPPSLNRDPATPYALNTGDALSVHCEWNNTTQKTLTFGFEMCVGFGQYVDTQGLGNLVWDAPGMNWGGF